MKYLLTNDIYYIKSKYKYIMLFYIINLIILLFNMNNLNDRFVLSYLGLYVDYTYIFIYTIYYFYSMFVPIFFAVIMYNKDFNNKADTIFTRINVKKWCCIRIILIYVLVVVIKLLSYIISSFFIKGIFEYYLYDILMNLVLVNVILILFSFFNNYQYSFIIFMVIIMFKLKYDIFLLDVNISYVLIIFILLCILNIFCIRKSINMQFERSDI